MKFLCSHCKAKYQIADERLAGRTLRMNCRSCGQEIVLRGDVTASGRPVARSSMPAAPSPLGADFHSNVASLHPSPPAVPIDEWHVAIDDQPVGPMRREEVARRLAAGGLGPESLAWREGLDDWMPIRAIPELALLCPPSPHVPHLPLPPSPIGGRAGTAPAYGVEDWGPVGDRSSQLLANPLHDAPAPPVPSRMPSVPVLFAVACGFAFLMSLLTIFGARWLREQPQQQAANDATASASAANGNDDPGAAQAAGQDQGAAGTGADMTIELEDTVVKGSKSGAAQKPTTTTAPRTTQAKKGKDLTDEQKAMLARMGGDQGSDLSALQRSAKQGASASKGPSGSLNAEQLRSVVQRGQKNLQRCYESALRGAGSDDTIRMDVQITVSPAGNVTQVTISGQGLPGMSECITRTIKMWRFPNAGEASATKFPLLFQPGA